MKIASTQVWDILYILLILQIDHWYHPCCRDWQGKDTDATVFNQNCNFEMSAGRSLACGFCPAAAINKETLKTSI